MRSKPTTAPSTVSGAGESSATAPTPPAASLAPLDPFGAAFFPDAATLQMQMQLMQMASNPFVNPGALLGIPGAFGPLPSFPMLTPGASPGLGAFAMQSSPLSSSSATGGAAKEKRKQRKESPQPLQLPLEAAPETTSKKEVGETKKGKEKKEMATIEPLTLAPAPTEATLAPQWDPLMLAGLDATAAANPFLLAGLGLSPAPPTSSPTAAATSSSAVAAASAGGIFGLNPFLAAGMMGGGAAMPPNLAAMAQLQSLMGMQGLESLMGAAAPAMMLPPPPTLKSETPHRRPSKDRKGRGKEEAAAKSGGGARPAKQPSAKLNALVDKLAAAKTSGTPPPASQSEERGKRTEMEEPKIDEQPGKREPHD